MELDPQLGLLDNINLDIKTPCFMKNVQKWKFYQDIHMFFGQPLSLQHSSKSSKMRSIKGMHALRENSKMWEVPFIYQMIRQIEFGDNMNQSFVLIWPIR